MSVYVYIAVMALVTYLIRVLPLTIFQKKIENRYIQSFLYYVPYTCLSAMTFPAILYATESVLSAAAGIAAALVLDVDFYQNEIAFKEATIKWAGNDEESRRLIEKLNVGEFSMEYFAARNALMEKYGYNMLVDGTDYNLIAAQVFNPYYSLADFYNYINSDYSVYEEFLRSDEFNKFSLLGKTDYQVPFYNINGDKDYQTNYLIAQDYFESVNAPRKKLYIMKDTTHGLLESKSEEFSDIVHEIAQAENGN